MGLLAASVEAPAVVVAAVVALQAAAMAVVVTEVALELPELVAAY